MSFPTSAQCVRKKPGGYGRFLQEGETLRAASEKGRKVSD